MSDKPKTPVVTPNVTPAQTPVKNRRARATIDQNETKDQRFVRLANKRVRRAIKLLRHIGNLAVKSNYEYTPEQAKKLVETVLNHAELVRQRFEGSPGDNGQWSL